MLEAEDFTAFSIFSSLYSVSGVFDDPFVSGKRINSVSDNGLLGFPSPGSPRDASSFMQAFSRCSSGFCN